MIHCVDVAALTLYIQTFYPKQDCKGTIFFYKIDNG